MVQIHNSNLSKELAEGAKVQVSYEAIPTQLADKVVPVMEVNPKLLRVCNISKRGLLNNATSATIFTTPTDKDFYLVAAQAAFIKDATSTATTLKMTITTEESPGNTGAVILFPALTLTADSGSSSVSIIPPIKLSRGSTIQLTSDTNVANIKMDGCIQGFTIENTNA